MNVRLKICYSDGRELAGCGKLIGAEIRGSAAGPIIDLRHFEAPRLLQRGKKSRANPT